MADVFRLITLGRLALLAPDGDEDPSLAARRLKLVLLAVLACSRRPLSRNTLLALFWPEQEEARARHSLSDALSHLRRVLGAKAITTRRAEVSLAPGVLAVDAGEFGAAVEQGDPSDLDRAILLYGGPFLEGVHVSGSQDLEEWIARERTRLAALFTRAAAARCAVLDLEGRWDESAMLASRWLDAAPLSGDAARFRLKALAATGTRDGIHRALQDYQRLAARLEDDYGRGPDRAVAALAEELQTALLAAEPTNEFVVTLPETVSSDSPSGPSVPLSTASRSSVPRLPRRIWAMAVLVAGSALAYRALGHRAGGLAAPDGSIADGSDRILLADFQNGTHDSLIAGAIGEALRVDLEESRAVQLLGPEQVKDALSRMERSPVAGLGDSLAREVALRDGVKAIVTGDVDQLGAAYTIATRLVSAQDGGVLAAFRETALDSTQLIDAVNRLSHRVRGRLGEALGQIQASPPLEQVTTSSLQALRKYSQAVRAGDWEGNDTKAIDLLQEAIRLDTGFAMAYRKLGSEWTYLASPRYDKALEASTLAFQHRDRLSDRERYLTMAGYYLQTNQPDQAAAGYRAVLDHYPRDVRALNNLGSIYIELKDFARAEELRRRAIEADSNIPRLYNNLAQAQFSEGKYPETARTLALAEQKFPGFAPLAWTGIALAAAQRDFATAERQTRALLSEAGTDYDHRAQALRLLGNLALVQGRVGEAEQETHALLDLIEREGDPADYIERSAFLAFISTELRHQPAQALRILDAAIARYPLARLPPLARHSEWLGYNYAIAGRPERARALLAAFEATHPVLGIGDTGAILRTEGAAQLAERDYRSAQQTLARSAESYWCPVCSLPDLARAYDLAGQRDSAIAVYRRYVTTPWVNWLDADGEFHGRVYARLAALYEEKGDTVHAVAAYRSLIAFWAQADSVLQPAVAGAKARVRALGGKE